jgi:MYXO-CTERM domain-containing protein
MRFLSSLSAGLLALAFTHGALAASQGPVSVAGRFPVAGGTLESAARVVVRDAIPSAASADLDVARSIALTSGERVIKLRQTYRGVPVALRGAAVTFGADGVARHVSARLEDDLPASVTPSLSAADAVSVAEKRTGLRAEPTSPLLAIWPTPDGAKLAWAVAPTAFPGSSYVPVVIVDAASGEVIAHYNAAHTLNQANVYPSNPIKSPTLTQVTLPVGTGETTLQSSLVVSKNCIDTKMVKAISFMGFNLNVHTCELQQTAVADSNGDFLSIMPADDKAPEDAFSEVSMFHHVNRAYEFFRGFDSKLDVNNGQPIPTVSNLRLPQGIDTFDLTKLADPNLPLTPFQNAFFAPSNPIFATVFGISGGAMWFGQGPLRDYSYDGDVVYHEFTHSVVNVTLQLVGTAHMDQYGASQAPGAMNEGLADYFSSAIAGDPDVGEYASKDIDPNLTVIRTLANKDTCPKDIGGEVHQDSTLFSGALWDTRVGLGDATKQAAFDRAVFTAMNSSATGDLGYEDFAKLVKNAVLADATLGQTVADALDKAFTAHGVLPACTRVLEYTGTTLNGPAALQNLWFAPGTDTTVVKNKDGWTPGVVQAHYKLPANSAKLTVDFKKVDIGGGGGFGTMGTPFKPTLLVRFDAAPITFTYKPLTPAANTQVVAPTAMGNNYTATIDVPAGATDAYVMVGSSGSSDGAYTALSLTAMAGSSTSTSTSSGGDVTSSAASTGGATGDMDSGCGCAVPGSDPLEGTATLAAIAALGLALARRRRR